MKSGESLKNYVSYFQSQMALVYNCNENVIAAVFISGLQVTHSFYKHLVKNDVTKMRDIFVRAQNTCRSRKQRGVPLLAPQTKVRG